VESLYFSIISHVVAACCTRRCDVYVCSL